jgi:hypothetical protein
VMSTQTTYVDKTRKNKTMDLWHAWFGHVCYNKMKVMIVITQFLTLLF